MGSISGAGISSIVFGSLALFFGCGQLIFVIYFLAIVGVVVGGSAYYGYTWFAVLPSVLMLVAGSLAIAAGAKTIQKGTWIAAIIFSMLTMVGYGTLLGITIYGLEHILGDMVHSYVSTFYALLCIPIALGIGMVVSGFVGTCQSDTLKERQLVARQQNNQLHLVAAPGNPTVIIQGPPKGMVPQYNPQVPPPYPQAAQPYYAPQPSSPGVQEPDAPLKNYY